MFSFEFSMNVKQKCDKISYKNKNYKYIRNIYSGKTHDRG